MSILKRFYTILNADKNKCESKELIVQVLDEKESKSEKKIEEKEDNLKFSEEIKPLEIEEEVLSNYDFMRSLIEEEKKLEEKKIKQNIEERKEKLELLQAVVNSINAVKEKRICELKLERLKIREENRLAKLKEEEEELKLLEEIRILELEEEVFSNYDFIKKLIEDSIKVQKQLNNKITLEKILIDIILEIGYKEVINEYLSTIKNILEVDKENKLNIENIDFIKNIINDNFLYIDEITYKYPRTTEYGKNNKHTCRVIFYGRYIKCKSKQNEYFEINLNKKGLISVDVTESRMISNTKFYHLNFNNYDFGTMSSLDIEKITSYYSEMNKVFQEEINKDKIIIYQQVEEVTPNVVQLVLNFLTYFPSDVLLDRKRYVDFMTFISRNDYYTKLIVDYDLITNNFSGSVKGEAIEIYNKFSVIIEKYLNVDNEIKKSITWVLIKKYSINHYGEIFNKEYGNNFNDIKNKTKDELVKIYCRIEEINPKDNDTIGIFTYFLMYHNKFNDNDNYNFLVYKTMIMNNVLEECKEKELEEFENKLLKTEKKSQLYSIDEVDLMNGYEFEEFLEVLFKKMGYSTEITKGSGDQGVDILIEKNGKRIGVQAKCYSSNVSNKAIQEVVAGLKYYNCYKGIVVTNNYFTQSAKELASVNNVILWDKNMLKQKIESVLNK